MAMKPAAGGDEILRWFWAETAMASSCGGFAIAWTPRRPALEGGGVRHRPLRLRPAGMSQLGG